MKSFNEWRKLKESEDRFKGYSWVDDLDQGSEKMGNLKQAEVWSTNIRLSALRS